MITTNHTSYFCKFQLQHLERNKTKDCALETESSQDPEEYLPPILKSSFPKTSCLNQTRSLKSKENKSKEKIYNTGQAGDAQTLSSLITAFYIKKKKTLGDGQGNHAKRLTYIATLAQRVPGSYKSQDFRV